MTVAVTPKLVGLGAAWSLINQSAGQLLSLLVFLVTARYVSKEAFGVMAVCMVIIDCFRQMWADSVGMAIAAKNAPTANDYNASFFLIACGNALFSALIFVTAPVISNFVSQNNISSTLRWFSIVLLADGLSRTHEAWLMKHMLFRVIAFRSIIAASIGGGIGTIMAVSGFGLHSLITQQLVGSVIGAIWLWFATAWRPCLQIGWSNVAGIFQFSRHISTSSAANILGYQADMFFTSLYLGPEMTGVYNAAKRIINAFSSIFSTALNSVFLHALADVSDDPERLKRWFRGAIASTSFATAPLYCGLAALSPDLIRLALGEKWVDAAPVLSVLAVTGFVSSIAQHNNNIILVMQKPHWLFRLTVVNAVSNIIMFALVGRMGITWIAGAVAVRSVLLLPLSSGCALKLVGLTASSYYRAIMPSVIAAGVMCASISLLRDLINQTPILNTVLLVPVGATIYAVTSWSLNRRMVDNAGEIGRRYIFMRRITKLPCPPTEDI